MTIAELAHGVRATGEPKSNMRGLIRWISLLLALNALVLFILIPVVSARLMPLYNQDRYIDGYNMLAENLVAGNGYRFYPDSAPTLMREPGYPLLLAGIFRLFGESISAVQIVNMCFVAGAALLTALIAQKLSSRKIALVLAPLIFLLHPGTLIAESRAGVEAVLSFFFALSILLIYRAIESNKWSDYAVAGAALGLTVLVRSTPIVFPLFLFAFCVLGTRRNSSAVKKIFLNMAVFVAAMLLVISPWIIRNMRLTGHFVPTASVLGISAHAGQYICEHIGEGRPWFLLDREASRERGAMAAELGYRLKPGEVYYQVFYNPQDELTFSSYLFRKVVDTYRASPSLCLKCMSLNLANFWIAGKSWQSRVLNGIVQVPILVCAVWGLVISLRSGKRLSWLLFLFIGYSVAVCVPILAQARYSVPLLPMVSALVATALGTIWDRHRSGRVVANDQRQ
jgi:4-amino-4-deoxy-L-arabinose transferase-like glycosyltransferase